LGAAAISATPEWQQRYVAFQDALQCRLAGIWEEMLEVSRVGVRDRFADLGGDAVKARRIIGRINKVFRKTLPASLMCGGITVEALAGAIFRELPFEPVSVIQPEALDSKPPVFFVHGDVFGGGLYTIELARHLGADRSFFSFNPHGMDGQSMPESIEKMAEDYLMRLRGMRPRGPFWLGGYCGGALIAYEMARILEREGPRLGTPVLLVEAPAGDMSESTAAEQGARAANRPGAGAGPQMRKAWVLNELFRLCGRYRPGKYAGPVVMVQPQKSLSDGVRVRTVWEKVSDTLDCHIMPGDHISCIGRHVPELSEIFHTVIETHVPL
jgi:thioesterase domain-containing protein